MTYFIVYMEQVEYQEYDLVVEAESIKSIKDKWDEISVLRLGITIYIK